MKFTVVSEAKWEKVSIALQSWDSGSDFHINQAGVVDRERWFTSIYVLAKGFDEKLAADLNEHFKKNDIKSTMLRDGFFGPFIASVKLATFWEAFLSTLVILSMLILLASEYPLKLMRTPDVPNHFLIEILILVSVTLCAFVLDVVLKSRQKALLVPTNRL